jgi:Gpi18-like mannosyltransferase
MEFQFKNSYRVLLWTWLCLLFIASLPFKMMFFSFESRDYQLFLNDWYNFISANGGFKALRHDFTPYGLPYLYLLVMATWLPLPKIVAIKLISVAFDYVAAFFTYKIVSLRYRQKLIPAYAACVALFLPTVIFNSSAWGQCDVIYTSSFLACLYAVLIGRPVAALIAFGLACSLKPQAVFIVPFLFGLLLNGSLPWRLIFIPPVVYILTGLPALLIGRPTKFIAFTHVRLGNMPLLSLHAPNIYQFVLQQFYPLLKPLGLAATLLASLWLARSMAKWHPPRSACHNSGGTLAIKAWSSDEENERLLVAALLSTLIVPYLLPQMHERYFFPADMISLIYAFFFPRRAAVAILVQLASFFSYFPWGLGIEPVPMFMLAVMMTAALVLVLKHYFKIVQSNPGPNEPIIAEMACT